MSLELGSRGCPEVVAVDKHPGCVSYIRKTSAELGLPVRVYRSEVLTFLRKWKQPGAFDLVFADPPYAFSKKQLLVVLDELLQGDLLTDEALIIFEHPVQYDFKDHPGLESSRDYGSSRFSFFEKSPG
jgi:16S rRNA G966 N2-methylase RsmD